MRARILAVLASGLLVAACQQSGNAPSMTANPASPSSVVDMSSADVPFHSEIVWTKVEGSQVGLCDRPAPAGKVYLMRNTQTGTHVTTHLGEGAFLGHTCVYGIPPQTPGGRPVPQGWFADFQWTAANGDVLMATSEFQYWTGVPGQSIAVDNVTFQDGGTGRFQYAQGQGQSFVNAPARTAMFEGTLRYGKKDK
jgi:hypothetical protein